MQGRALLLALVVVATSCSPGPQSGASPAATALGTLQPVSSVTPTTIPASSPTLTPSASPPTSAPSPTPVARTVNGRATLTTGAAVAGVRVRAMPASINDGRAPGPDVAAVTDDRGDYTLSVLIWTPEVLVNSSSIPLMVEIVPPVGFIALGVTRSLGGPIQTGAAGPSFHIGDLDGPIDITLQRGHVVEGRVSSGPTGAPLAGIGVAALGLDSMLIYGSAGDAFGIAATGMTDTNGRYKLTVPSGTYVIHTPGPQGAQPRFWSDDPAVFQATPVRVERDIAGIDIVVVPVTQIWGHVRSGPSFADGVDGTRVAAYLAGGTSCCRVVGVAMTGHGGTFVMHVPPGTYRLVFDPPTGSPYAAQWWRSAAGFATATDVRVASDRLELEVELTKRP